MKYKYFLKITLALFTLFFFQQNLAQVISDNFEDGDLTGWTEGTVSDWTNSTSSPITGTRSLKHNLSGVSDNSYTYHNISSLDLTTQDITWSFNIANGIGRFYLHTKSSVLSINTNTLNNVTIFNIDNIIKITGLSNNKTTLRVFNILGKQIIDHSFESSNGIKEISLPKTSSGVYILQIENRNRILNKKIIIN